MECSDWQRPLHGQRAAEPAARAPRGEPRRQVDRLVPEGLSTRTVPEGHTGLGSTACLFA